MIFFQILLLLFINYGISYHKYFTNDQKFLNDLNNNNFVIVNCMVPYSYNNCKIDNKLKKINNKYNIKIINLNIDENPLTVTAYRIINLSTILLFNNTHLLNNNINIDDIDDVLKSYHS